MTNRDQTITVEEDRPLERLDTYLRGQFPAVSRGTMQRLIDQGNILVNGKEVKTTYRPKAGDQVSVTFPATKPALAKPEHIPLEVLFEDEDLLVLNKAPGLVVHPGCGHDEHTLVNALLHHCQGQLSGIGGVARPGIVHRLDKDTSGCLLVAKHDRIHLALAGQFQNREIRKVYRALVCGRLTQDSGEIRASIARHPTHRKRMAATDGGGRAAWTSYQRLEQLHGADFVEALLHTGRTHQIRVHFQHLGHPLVGDDIYGARQNQRLEEETRYRASRQMLHACEISFRHPRYPDLLTFSAPLPEDFAAALASLRAAR